jgi:DHA3 family tetracycline resistance protein-like MFS transporter
MNSERFFLGACLFYGLCWSTMVTVNLVYMVKVAGLDPFQMVLVGTVLEATVFVFEIPTGVLADVISRRTSVIVGHFLTGTAFLEFAFFPSFWTILLSQIIWGVGAAFISGAYVAWLTDEVGVEKTGGVLLRGSQRGKIGSALGILLSVALAQVSLRLPIVAGSVGILALSLAMILLMREENAPARPAGRTETWSAMRTTFAAGLSEIRSSPLLGLIIAITLIFGAFSEGFDRLYTPFLLGRFTFPPLGMLNNIGWWGVIALVSNGVAWTVTALARRYVKTTSHTALTLALGVCTAAIGIAVVVFANVNALAAVLVFYWFASGLRAARGPLMTTWLNQHLPSRARATLLSMMGQADAVGQTAGGPVIGYVAKQLSIALALTASAAMLVPSLFLYRRASALGGEEQAST